jgi:hypothetical protein
MELVWGLVPELELEPAQGLEPEPGPVPELEPAQGLVPVPELEPALVPDSQ